MAVVASAAQHLEKAALGRAAKHTSRAPSGNILWDQNTAPGLFSISSQDFEAIYDAYDDMGAADFVVPAATSWSVTGAFVPGIYFNGTGPMPLLNVIFFNNSGSNTPGTAVCTYTGLVAGADFTDSAGTLDITFPSPCPLSGGPTTFWMEVQADMDAGVGGQWGWTDHTTNPPGTFLGKWQNPGGGFGVCPQWGDLQTCIPTADGPDYAFQLIGQIVPVELQHFSIE
jgi:hypothetical protein